MHLRVIDTREATALVGVVVAFGVLVIGGRRALVQAQAEAPRVLAGIRLSFATLIASVVAAGLDGFVYYSETGCNLGPPSAAPPLCALETASGFVFVAAALMFLVSFFLWPPWRRPLRLQLVRAALGLGWLGAFVLGLMAAGFLFDT